MNNKPIPYLRDAHGLRIPAGYTIMMDGHGYEVDKDGYFECNFLPTNTFNKVELLKALKLNNPNYIITKDDIGKPFNPKLREDYNEQQTY